MTSVSFKEGEDVEKGQVLATLDKRPFEAALQQAQATLEKDTAQAANARSQAARYQDLLQRGIATREQVDTMRTQAAALEATAAADRASLENAKVQLTYATITAPMAGRTGLLQVHPGNLVRAQDTQPNVTVTLTSDPNAIVVPSVAVQTGQQGTYVFTVQPDQTVELRPVTVARLAGDETVVQTGVSAGDTVVTDGHLRLVPGSRISVKNANATRATP